MVIILTVDDDVHVPFVTKHLKNLEVVRIDSQDVIKGDALSYFLHDGSLRVEYKGKVLSDVTGVWVRRPTRINNLHLPIEERFLPYSRSALVRHMRQLYTAFPNARWVSDDYAIQRASNKSYQLRVAHQLGLAVPDTLFTSDVTAATTFIQQHDFAIIKMQANNSPRRSDGRGQSLFSIKVSKDDLPDLSGLELAPAIFQEAIEPEYELRVTIIGKKVFASKIILDGVKENNRQRDWRLGYLEGQLHIAPYELPVDIAAKSIQLLEELRLNFGAIDFIKDRFGVYWFLEINPNGQWAFIEEETSQPIGKAIADFLTNSADLQE